MDSIKSLGELSMGSRLKRMSDMCMRVIQKAYHHYNIDFDPYLFPAFHLIATEGKTTNTTLCESLQTTQPAVTQNINKLVQKGLIKWVTDAGDKRKKIISLSAKGALLFHQMKPLWQAMDETVKKYTHLPADSLLEHIDHFEAAVKSGAFLNTIIEIMETHITTDIVSFDPRYKQAFYDLNIEWLETYFYVEDLDKEVLSQPEKYILNPGGHIFFAIENGEAIGTVALMKVKEGHFELTKMAVRPDQRGKKIGQQLMQYCIDFARTHQFEGLYLYSNTLLENAIYIYRKFGFEEVALEKDSPYERSNIKMVFPL